MTPAVVGKIKTPAEPVHDAGRVVVRIVGIAEGITVSVHEVYQFAYSVDRAPLKFPASKDVNQVAEGIHHVIVIPDPLNLILLRTQGLKIACCAIILKYQVIV